MHKLCIYVFIFIRVNIFLGIIIFFRKQPGAGKKLIFDWRLLKCVTLLYQSLFLFSVSLMNISLAFFLAVILMPITVIVQPTKIRLAFLETRNIGNSENYLFGFSPLVLNMFIHGTYMYLRKKELFVLYSGVYMQILRKILIIDFLHRLLLWIQKFFLLLVSPGVLLFIAAVITSYGEKHADFLDLLVNSWSFMKTNIFLTIIDKYFFGSWMFSLFSFVILPNWLMFWSIAHCSIEQKIFLINNCVQDFFVFTCVWKQ